MLVLQLCEYVVWFTIISEQICQEPDPSLETEPDDTSDSTQTQTQEKQKQESGQEA